MIAKYLPKAAQEAMSHLADELVIRGTGQALQASRV